PPAPGHALCVHDALPISRVQTLLLGAQRQGEQHLWGSIDEPVLVAKNQADLDGSGKTFRAPASALMLRSAVAADSQFTELLDQGRTSADNRSEEHTSELQSRFDL